MQATIAAGILFLIAAVAFVLSIRSFMGKGFLLNNAYLYASEKERQAMDKKPYYRQTAIVMLLIGFIFMLNGFAALFPMDWISYAVGGIIIAAIVYAVVSGIVIERRKK